MLSRVFFYQRQVTLAFIICTLSQLLIHLFQTLLHLGDVGKRLLSLLTYGRRILQIHDLRQIANRGILWNADRSIGWLLLSAKYFEQSRFARTVLAYEGNTVLVVDHETGVRKQRLDAKFYTQSFY